MQLGDVEWLGPDTITDRLSDMANDAGVLVLGSPPTARPVLRTPVPIKSVAPVELPHIAMTARDAVATLHPVALAWAPDASLTSVMSSVLEGAPDERDVKGVWLDEHGRTTPVGGWTLLFRSASRAECLNLSLLIETAQLVRIEDAFDTWAAVGTIADDWIDSDAVAHVTEPLYRAWRTPDTPPLHHRGMHLLQIQQVPCWLVVYICWQRGAERRDLSLAVDAVTGQVTVREQTGTPASASWRPT